MTMTDGQSVMLRLFIPYKLLHCQSGHLLGWHDVAAPYHEIKNGVRNVTTAIVWGISKIHVPEDCNSETVGELGIFECPKSPLKTWKSTINRHLFIHLIINDYGYIDITHLRLESRLLVPSKDCCIFLFEPRSYVSLMPEVLQNSTFRMGSQNDFYFRSGPFGDSTVHKRPDILSMFTVSLSQFRTSSISKYAEDSSQNFTRGNSGYQLETVVSHAIAQSILSILSHLAAHLNSITGFW